ncbi:LmeA family phospholipid-binding protein [Anthocerotibacter panamensis]|uniref:LmeA family phospholipid-binding protein n=1 Tax=Anthocerotibacter panamensis TaxID=2857077 RepID=UPI001C40848F|nr:DUF2993 domain-containing protein [Anthocerotibacter panamensis]
MLVRLRPLYCCLLLVIGGLLGSLSLHAQSFSSLLSPLVQVWVRSQVERVEDLQVQVTGPDQDVVNGQIQKVQISGRNVRYQGIAARSVALSGSDIRLDTTGVFTGAGLRLLKPVRTNLTLGLSEDNLNEYLSSSAFQEQIRSLEVQLPAQFGGDGANRVRLGLQSPHARLQQDRLELSALIQSRPESPPTPIKIATGVEVASARQLKLVNPGLVLDSGERAPIEALNGLIIPLGEDLEIRRATLLPGQLSLEGSFLLQPTPIAIR